MFYSGNEYNLSEKQLSGCQSMIAWFSDVNVSLALIEILCHTYVSQESLYSGYIYCWYYYNYCYNLDDGILLSFLGFWFFYGLMHISTI